MKDTQDKGYSRGEIQQQIAEAEIIISAMTLKEFLAREQKDAGRKRTRQRPDSRKKWPAP